MVLVKSDVCQTKWVIGNRFDDIPEGHVSRFLLDFTNEFLGNSLDENFVEKPGRPIYPKKTLLNILIYGEINRISSTEELADLVKYHHFYNFVADDATPSARTLRRFKEDYGYLFEFILQSTLIRAKNNEITDFDHIAIDGTIIKANNSNYNVIKLEEIELLLKLLNQNKSEINKYLKSDEGKNLRKSAYKLLKNKNKTQQEKIDLLKNLKDILLESEQSSIGLSDSDARWMKNKKNQTELGFNVQSSVDHKSKLILVFEATQDPTDHNQLINQIKNIKNVLGEYPTKISADYGYRTHENLKFLKFKDIDGYIPNQKQSRENKGKEPDNLYHKDYFIYDEEIDAYICPENQVLPYQRQYTYQKRPRRMYYTKKCKNCPVKKKCTKSNWRTISEFGDYIEKEMKIKMDSTEGKEEYSKRMSTVEPVFGILKKQHNLNELEQRKMDRIQTELNLMAAAYNIKQLHAHKIKNKKEKERVLEKNLENLQTDFQTRFPNGNLEINFVNQKKKKS